MKSNSFLLDITTIERPLLENSYVQKLTIVTKEGVVTILPDHEPLVASLGTGEATIHDSNGKKTSIFIDGGVVQFINNTAEVLADWAEKAEELEEAKISEAIRRAEKLMHDKPVDIDITTLEATLRRETQKAKFLQKWQRMG